MVNFPWVLKKFPINFYVRYIFILKAEISFQMAVSWEWYSQFIHFFQACVPPRLWWAMEVWSYRISVHKPLIPDFVPDSWFCSPYTNFFKHRKCLTWSTTSSSQICSNPLWFWYQKFSHIFLTFCGEIWCEYYKYFRRNQRKCCLEIRKRGHHTK